MSAPRRFLIRAPNWLGDIVMALPAIAAFRRGFPDAAITVAAPAPFAPLFHERTNAGEVAVLPLAAAGTGAELLTLRRGRFDTVVLLTNSFGSAWLARRARIPERWGFSTGGRRLLLTRAVPTPRRGAHQVDYYRSLADGLGMPTDADAQPAIEPASATHAAGDTLLEQEHAGGGPIVGFGPGAAYGYAKRWPPPYVAEVIRGLAARGATCLLLGSRGDAEAGAEIESALGSGSLAPGRLVNLIGRTDLRQLVGVLARCDLFVSNDSGAMHVAAALGRPVIALFGPTDERATAPRGRAAVLTADVFCRPCMLRDCPIDHRCMKRIRPETVIDAAMATLG